MTMKVLLNKMFPKVGLGSHSKHIQVNFILKYTQQSGTKFLFSAKTMKAHYSKWG